MELEGRHAVVTGAAGGIGAALVQGFPLGSVQAGHVIAGLGGIFGNVANDVRQLKRYSTFRRHLNHFLTTTESPNVKTS